MRTRFYITIGLLFILAGFLLGFDAFTRYWREQRQVGAATRPFAVQQVAAAANDTTAQDPRIDGKPVRMVLPSLGLDLAVAEGRYNAKDGSWTLSKDKAHYAVATPQANNKSGNTFIYGHNRREVFAKLSKLKVGDQVELYTENGHRFVYQYREKYVTSPKDTSLFDYQGRPILTVQTCSGVWFENRSLYTFDLVEVG